MGQAYNPRTGTVARGGVAAGPYGARGAAEAYNPRTGAYGATRQGSSAYGSWGSTSVQRGNQWANTQRTTNNATGVTTRTTQSSAGSSASVSGPGGRSSVAQSNSGDLYAGHDGNVYKKSDSGSWQKYDNGGWNSTAQPTPQQREQAQNRATQAGAQAREKAGAAGYDPSQLNRDARARSEGAQRTRDLGSVRSGAPAHAPEAIVHRAGKVGAVEGVR